MFLIRLTESAYWRLFMYSEIAGNYTGYFLPFTPYPPVTDARLQTAWEHDITVFCFAQQTII